MTRCVERINDTLRFARVSRAGEQALVLSMPLRLDGGVTVELDGERLPALVRRVAHV